MKKKTYNIFNIGNLAIILIMALVILSITPVFAENPLTEEGDLSEYTGFIREIDGTIYYYENGEKAKGLKKIEGETYFFNEETCVMEYGFKKMEDETYYFEKSTGKMAKGFTEIGKNTYYFGRSTGKMYKGLHKIKKNVYRFNDEGKMTRKIYHNKKAICLTYDDGPAEHTRRIMQVLKNNNGSATFFMVGSRIPYCKTIVKEMSQGGFQMANHTFSHPMLANMSLQAIGEQVKKCNRNIKKYGNQDAKVMRTPGGQINDTIRKGVDMPIILWSIDTMDWYTKNADNTYKKVVNSARDGDIVLMHDLHESTKYASEKIIPKLIKKGFQLVTVEEMALLKGVKLKKGAVYFRFS